MKWDAFGKNLNDAFFYVIDIIVHIQDTFWEEAMSIGRIVLLIAILSAALNYALTGTGLKENVIKILKATLFFLAVMFAYPNICGFIASWTFELAEKSVYGPVKSFFDETVKEIVEEEVEHRFNNDYWNLGPAEEGVDYDYDYDGSTKTVIREITKTRDNKNLLGSLVSIWDGAESGIAYSTMSPAAGLKIIFFIANECIKFADNSFFVIIPEFSRVLKGFICAFMVIFTGVFALLEYIICFLEFMLVSSVGIILLPFSIWDGSKFITEKFIGAMVGFFLKLLMCNLAVFILIFGYVNMFYIIHNSFTGGVDQIVFIAFTCLLFFYICKSAPSLAQSLMGGPSLNASGAISAVTGAVAAAGAVMKMAKSAGSTVAGGSAKAIVGSAGALAEADAASNAVKEAGGSGGKQALAFADSLGSSIGNSFKAGVMGLTRSSQNRWDDYRQTTVQDADGSTRSQTFNEYLDRRRDKGARLGRSYMDSSPDQQPRA